MYNQHQDAKRIKQTQVSNKKELVTDFGDRAVSRQNFSKIVALPRQALENCGRDITRVNVKLVQTDTERFLKLTPIQGRNPHENDKMEEVSA